MVQIKMKIKKGNSSQNKKPTRKQLRKEKRILKKVRRNEYYTNRSKLKTIPGQFVKNPNSNENKSENCDILEEKPEKQNDISLNVEQERRKEKNLQKRLEKDMRHQRNKQLLEANEDEDKNIKKLEKQLKLNKRKHKNVPKSFTVDGLDYLLEVCDAENMKSAVATEQQFVVNDDEFAEDFALMSGKNSKKLPENEGLSEDNMEIDDEMDEEDISEEEEAISGDELDYDSEDDEVDNEIEDSQENFNEELSDDELHNEDSENSDSESQNRMKGAFKVNPDGTWEDIYGRLRAKDGTLMNNSEQVKYVPPAVRAKMAQESSQDKKTLEKLSRLKKQLKGLINRLAESNMHNIASQIEELYMNNSRNDMNETLTELIFDSITSNTLTPERLLIEHVLLIVILQANVGTEVGAHFLQTIITKFDKTLSNISEVEDKTLDNIVIALSQLYNFKMFDSKLMYEILQKLSEIFNEKNIDCILHILKKVGFNLRKDDPLALKSLILELQKKAASVSENILDGSRVKFLLDILLAIKNNNVSKIPNNDNSYSEHLKKVMKGFIRKGNYVTQLNISLDDLLRAEEKGKWWLVGSAWTGNASENNEKVKKPSTQGAVERFSQKLLELARKQRMNTDTRRNIFCIIISAEDYLDAFEKLLHLGLTNNQEREIIYVILHCCLQENSFNPYYAHLAQKFCDYDRRFQLTIKYSVWDKLKAIEEQSTSQVSNLAKLLTHLFLEKGLPISTLKIVQFSELDKLTLRFIRQILLGILLHDDIETCIQVFEKISKSEKLKMFRESLRLFIHHFLLKNISKNNTESVDEKQREILETRAKIIDKILVMKESSKF